MTRRVVVVAAASAVAAALIALLVHAPFVRARVLQYALARVQEQYGLRIAASRLDYNLAALRIGLADLQVAAPATASEPFFTADYLSVVVPWRSLTGGITFDDITANTAAVHIVRRADGTTNLPPSSANTDDEPAALRIGHLALPQLEIDILDEPADFALRVPAAAIDLRADGGRIAISLPADVRLGARATRITRFAGDASFDGRALHLMGVDAVAEEASLRLDGSVALIVRDPTVDLRVTGQGDVARLARWGMTGANVPEGTIAFSGNVAGPLNELRAEMELASESLSWQSLNAANVNGRARVTSRALNVEQLQFDLDGGRVAASGSLPFNEDVTAAVIVSWTDVPMLPLVQALALQMDVMPSAVVSGTVDAQGALSNPDEWVIDGRFRAVPGSNGRGRVAIGGAARLLVLDGTWRLDGQHVVGNVVPLEMAIGGRFGGGRPEGRPLRTILQATPISGLITVSETDIPALLDMLRVTALADVPENTLTAGAMLGELRLTGTTRAPLIAFDVRAPRQLVVSGQGFDSVTARGRLDGEVLTIDALTARQPTTTSPVAGDLQVSGLPGLQAAGTYNITTQQYFATLDVTQWRLEPTADLAAAGVIDGRFTGTGTVDAPGGEGTLTIRDARWDEMVVGDIDADVRLDRGNAVVDARANAIDLGPLLQSVEMPVPVTGTASVTAHAEGAIDAWRTGTAVISIPAFEARAGELLVRLVEPARFRYAGERIVVDSFEGAAGDARISVTGDIAAVDPAPASAGLLVTVTGDIDEVARAVAATGITRVPITGGDGPVALLARVAGSLQTPVIAADLEVGPGSITLENLPAISDLHVRAHVEDGQLDLREATASFQGARLSATGDAPLAVLTGGANNPATPDTLTLYANVSNLTPAVLAPFLDPSTIEQLTGSIDATVDVSSVTLNVEDVSGTVTLNRLDVRIADLPVTQRVPTRILVGGGFARVADWDWTGQGATLAVRGQVRLVDRQAALLANGDIDLRMLTPFVREAGMSTAGSLQPRLSITGSLDAPRIDGDLSLLGGEIRLADPRVLISDLSGRAVLSRSTATITELAGTANGGPLTGSGSVEYRADGQIISQLSTSIRAMALEFPAGLRSELDGDLTLALNVGGPPDSRPSGSVSGTVTLVRGAYREPLAVVTGLLDALRTRRLAAAEPSPLLNALALNIRLVTDEDVIVDNNYGRFQLGGDLRVIGTAATPLLSGRAELREGGQLFVGRNIYQINFGTIDFANPVAIEPELNVEATTRAGGEDIEVTISGTPDTMRVDLASSSNPDLGQAELASLLLTGRRFEDLAPGDAAFVGTQVLGNVSAEVLGFASRAVGLDTVRLGGVETSAIRRDTSAVASELDPTTRLTFGKSIGPDVDLTFSQSLRDTAAQTWIVDYLPVRRLELRFVSGDDNLRSFGFRHDVAFGMAPPTLQAQGVSQRQDQRVGEIQLGGQLVVPEAQVREQLRLESGDRFDFGAWQDDRDRLEQFYRRQGYLTVRVSASRSDATDAAVDDVGGDVVLTYQIASGPRTAIEVAGIALDAALRSRIETAWSESVFDEFLIDEAGAIVRQMLAADGYLQPTIEVRVVGDASVRTLSIAVTPGARTTTTAVRFIGADPALEGELTAWMEMQGLVDRAVQDPGAAERELTAYLRARGYLRVRVTAAPPVFEGSGASVPITVDAGPIYRASNVAFAGVQGIPVETVRDAVAIPEGAPYDPAAVEAARVRLIALYRREGFASPVVDVRTDVTAESSAVPLTFVVTEGPRQLLRNIVVIGNRGIDSDVVARAVGIELNAPLTPEALLRARTRVFETGLFRRVDVATEPAGDAPDATQLPMRLRITVEEWPGLRLRYGVQVAEERPEGQIEGRDLVPGLSADITRRTLFGRALTTGAAVQYQRRERLGRVFAIAPTLFGWPIESSLVLERAREEFTAVTLLTDRSSISWEQRARVLGNLSLSYSYRFDRDHTIDTAPNPNSELPPFDLTINIGRLTGSVAWDTRDDPANTFRGVLASAALEYAPEAAGSDIWFMRQIGQVYYFRPWRGMVLASAGRVGVVQALGEQELILTERFFAGGARTVRGVREEGLGELDVFGDPAGGQGLLVLNQEARVPIYKWLGGVAFADAGNVFARPRDISLRDLTGSVGVGLRLATPYALLRVDYAKPAWPGSARGPGRWTFGIGQAF